MYVYIFFKIIYILIVDISLWAIILQNMSYLIINCAFLPGSKCYLLILLLIQLMLLFINLEGNI